MAIETVQSVRQAEQLAAQKEKEAELEAEKMIAEAEEDARQHLVLIKKSSQESSQKASDDSKIQADTLLETSLEEAQKEIEKLRLDVNEKEKEAIANAGEAKESEAPIGKKLRSRRGKEEKEYEPKAENQQTDDKKPAEVKEGEEK